MARTPYCRRCIKLKHKCPTCIKRSWRAKNVMRDTWHNLCSNARRRKIFCDLTFEQFKRFAVRTNYIAGKGRSKESYTIDRMKDEKGYTVGNIRRITNGANVKKEHVRRKLLSYDYRTGYAKVI